VSGHSASLANWAFRMSKILKGITLLLGLSNSAESGISLPMTKTANDVIGVGPVIAAWVDGGRRPAYLYEVLFESGETQQIVYKKAGPGKDRLAKQQAVLDRISRANKLRQAGDVVLAHDEASFRALRAMAIRMSGLRPAV